MIKKLTKKEKINKINELIEVLEWRDTENKLHGELYCCFICILVRKRKDYTYDKRFEKFIKGEIYKIDDEYKDLLSKTIIGTSTEENGEYNSVSSIMKVNSGVWEIFDATSRIEFLNRVKENL